MRNIISLFPVITQLTSHVFKRHVTKDGAKNKILLATVFCEWKNKFEANKIAEPTQSAEHILNHVLGHGAVSDLYRNMNKIIKSTELQEINRLCDMRMQRMPVQYIIEEWDFLDMTLKMVPPIFIPRPETEMLVVMVNEEIKTMQSSHILDLCCGSGAISLGILKNNPHVHVTAVDYSQKACELTKLNAEKYNLLDRLSIIRSKIGEKNWYNGVLQNNYDMIVSNPPYILSKDMLNLQEEVCRYEDLAALHGGEDGLDIIKQILSSTPTLLKPEGKIFLEIDPIQPGLIQTWLENHPELLLTLKWIHKDFCNKNRFVEIHKC